MPLTHHRNGIYAGSIGVKVRTITSDYTVAIDSVLLVDSTSGDITVTIPAATSSEGLILNIKRLDSSANTITVATADSGTIDGAATLTVVSQYTAYTLAADDTSGNWFII